MNGALIGCVCVEVWAVTCGRHRSAAHCGSIQGTACFSYSLLIRLVGERENPLCFPARLLWLPHALQVVAQLWVAVVGALLLFASTSWLYGYLAAQGAHAARDLRELLAGYPHEQHQHHQGAGGVLAPAGAAAGAGSAEGV